MNKDEIRSRILKILGLIAPEFRSRKIQPNLAIRQQLEIDSVDFLNFAIRLHKEFGIEIPEKEYREIETLDNCVTYVERKTA